MTFPLSRMIVGSPAVGKRNSRERRIIAQEAAQRTPFVRFSSMGIAHGTAAMGIRSRMLLTLALAALVGDSFAAAREDDVERRSVRPLFTAFGVEAGLPSGWVNQVAQDRAGYLWIATADGLSRYDGVAFTTIRRGVEGGPELAGTAVESVFVDASDRLWIGMEGGGLSVLDADRRRLRRVGDEVVAKGEPHTLFNADVWALSQDRRGFIWAGAYDSGIHRVDPELLTVKSRRHDPANPASPVSNHALAIASGSDGRVWFGTTAGLEVVDSNAADGGLDAVKHLLSGELILSLAVEGDGSVLAGGRGKIWRVPPGPQAFTKPVLVETPGLPATALVQAMIRDQSDALWILTRRHGAWRMDASGRMHAIAPQPGLPLALPTRELLHGLRDRENNLWIATYGSGLLQVRASWRNFTLLRDDDADARAAEPGSWVGATRCPNGDTWMLRRNGSLLKFDRSSDRMRVERERITGAAAATAQGFTAMKCDGLGALWLGSGNGAITRLVPGNGSLQKITEQNGTVPLTGWVEVISADRDGGVWVATQGTGLTRFDENNPMAPPKQFAGGSQGLRVVEVEQIGRVPDGSLWIAGSGGIDRLAPDDSDFGTVLGAPDDTVHAFAFARDGTVWLHSHAGLLHARVNGAMLSPIARFGPQQGLERMEIGSLTVASDGTLWLLGSRGVRRLDPRTGQWRKFGAGDGFGVGELALRTAERGPDGSVLALGNLGALEFNPQLIADNLVAPLLRIESVSLRRGNDRLALPLSAPFRLYHDDRDLTVKARALSLVDSSANRYRFRLDPFDAEWREGSADGVRTYSSLRPGRYRLFAQGANNNGVWSRPETLSFTVDNPPWWGPAAWLGYVIAAIGMVVLIALQQRWRWQRRHEHALNEARREAAERANRAKSDFLADVAHEIRTPISGMSGMSDLLARTELDSQQRRYVSRMRGAMDMLLKLINNLLELARIESGHLELSPVATDLCALLQELIDLEMPTADGKQVLLKFECSADLPRWVAVDPLRMRQVLLNLLGNALKFIERGEVVLSADVPTSGWVRLRVRDTGPGLSMEAQSRLFQRFAQADGSVSQRHGGSGLGLAIVYELVELMQGRLTVESEPGVGSTFCVELPLTAVAPADSADIGGDRDTVSFAVTSIQSSPPLAENPAPNAPVSAPTPPKVPRLLIVEDDVTLAEALAGLLERDGFACTRAPHGLAALSELERTRFDVALIDFDLPGLSGLELSRMLRARGCRLRLIGISARADNDAEKDAQSAGMDLFLRKPIDPQTLRESLAAFLPSNAF